jgi:RimJ/RimL family protein N-acetyltransferase
MDGQSDSNIPVIASERLDLAWMSAAFIVASLDGRRDAAASLISASLPEDWPDEEARRRLAQRLEQMQRDPSEAPWLLRAMISRAAMEMVGALNFHGRPNAQGQAKLGYTVFPAHRQRGYATEAALAMMGWARHEHEVHRFLLSISPDNAASLRVADKLGFRRIGVQMDEIDGEEYVFELVLP